MTASKVSKMTNDTDVDSLGGNMVDIMKIDLSSIKQTFNSNGKSLQSKMHKLPRHKKESYDSTPAFTRRTEQDKFVCLSREDSYG
jgi:hypothetical protein